jgi:hypothetical protein
VVSIRIELDRAGVGELLRSDAVQAMLDSKADAVATSARGQGIRVNGEPGEVALPIITRRARTGSRARAVVEIDHPSGLAVEAKHRLLVGSLDAARGG